MHCSLNLAAALVIIPDSAVNGFRELLLVALGLQHRLLLKVRDEPVLYED